MTHEETNRQELAQEYRARMKEFRDCLAFANEVRRRKNEAFTSIEDSGALVGTPDEIREVVFKIASLAVNDTLAKRGIDTIEKMTAFAEEVDKS